MKTNKYLNILFLAAAATFTLSSCEDEVLVETEDTTTADAIIAEIEAATETLYTLDAENGTLTIENRKMANLIDSLDEVYDDLRFSSSNPTEVHYTVNVLTAANAEFAEYGGYENLSNGRSKGVAGATVRVEQDGVFHQPSSAAEGLYLFTGLKQGYVFVTVSAPDHTTVEYQAYIFVSSGEDVAGAKAYNASTQVTLYPNAGALAGTLYGKAYANTTIVNDTANRRYGSSVAIYGNRANTYITPMSIGGEDTNWFPSTFYGNNDDSELIFDAFPKVGHRIYAFPELNNSEMPNQSQNGYTYTVTYKGIVTSAAIAADGSYTLPIIAANGTDNLIDGIRLVTEDFNNDFVRFTNSLGEYNGQQKEAGDTLRVTLKYYNNSNSTVDVYTGSGTTEQSLAPNRALSVTRLTLREQNVQYSGYFLENGSMQGSGSYIDKLPIAGERFQRNVFFLPYGLFD